MDETTELPDDDTENKAYACSDALYETIMMLRKNKPDERSELSRRYAVTITLLEEAAAYFESWVIRKLD